MYQEKKKDMTQKEKLIKRIGDLLKAKNATKDNPIVKDIYLIRGDDSIGMIVKTWLGDDGEPRCSVNWWGITTTSHLDAISTYNLRTLRDYLRDGHVIQ